MPTYNIYVQYNDHRFKPQYIGTETDLYKFVDNSPYYVDDYNGRIKLPLYYSTMDNLKYLRRISRVFMLIVEE